MSVHSVRLLNILLPSYWLFIAIYVGFKMLTRYHVIYLFLLQLFRISTCTHLKVETTLIKNKKYLYWLMSC